MLTTKSDRAHGNRSTNNAVLTRGFTDDKSKHLQIAKFSFESNQKSNWWLQFESNQGVVVYMFNADCHRSCVGLLHTTGDYSWFIKQYCTIAPTMLASVYALAT